MLSRLVAFALSQRLLVAGLAVLLVVGGIRAYETLPIDAFPDMSTTQVKIIVKAPGMTPEEVETRIVVPIEFEMLGIPQQRILRSVSKYAIADITIDFHDGTDIYWARQQVTERLNGVLPELPPGVTGGLAPITTPLGEMFMFTIEGGDLSLAERRTLLDWVIRPRLRTVPGVADVNALGGYVRAFEVVPDVAALAARNISLATLERALEQNNRNDGAGRLSTGEESLLVRAEGRIRTLDDVRAIVVAERTAVPVRVGEVAQVRIGALTRYGAVTRDGEGEAVQGLVLGLRGANARQVVDGVRKRLDEIRPLLPPGVRIEVFYDRSALVNQATATVGSALVQGSVLVIALLVLFLGNLRAAVVVCVSIPLAALATFLMMRQAGMSANLMSLGGLAIAIGMLVDASIVVTENIVRHLDRDAGKTRKLRVVYDATREVAAPVVAATMIVVIVFLPLYALEGLEGKYFKPVASAIIMALSAALVIGLTVIPAAASIVVRPRPERDPWVVHVARRAYLPTLRLVLAHPRSTIAVAAVLLLAAGAAWFHVGKTFLPEMDEGNIVMQLEKLPSVSLDASLELDTRIQRAILDEVPEVEAVVARTGADEIGLDAMGLNQTDAFLVLKPRDEWRSPRKEDIVEALRRATDTFPGVTRIFTQPIEMRVSEMLLGVRGALAIKIFGPDLATLGSLARQIRDVVAEIPGNRDVFTLTNEGVQYLQVEIDRFSTGHQKLTVAEIQDNLRAQVEGRRVGTVLEGTRRTPLIVRGTNELRTSAPRFEHQNIAMPDGAAVPLTAVARLSHVDGPVKIDRENAQRYAVVQSSVLGRDLVGFVEEVQARVSERVPLPDGYFLTWGGQFENQQRAAARLAVMVPIALGLVFILLYTTFRSIGEATLVMANVPFALVGGILALSVSGVYLSVPASVGFIALLGIAVQNGVVLMSTFNQLRDAGLPLDRAIEEGASQRLRPVLMTAITTALGLLPLLAARGPGSEIQRPLAIVVTGGLITSTALTLLLLPLLHRRFGARLRREVVQPEDLFR
jgi:cobalt-zinc-cadmium resistance protein CzcA